MQHLDQRSTRVRYRCGGIEAVGNSAVGARHYSKLAKYFCRRSPVLCCTWLLAIAALFTVIQW